jgi:hypothetical protein
MILVGTGRRLELLSCADGSYGIRRDGALLGTREPDEEDACVDAFARFGELKGGLPHIMPRKPPGSVSNLLN